MSHNYHNMSSITKQQCTDHILYLVEASIVDLMVSNPAAESKCNIVAFLFIALKKLHCPALSKKNSLSKIIFCFP